MEGEGIPATDGTDLEIGIPRDAHAASQSLELLEISRGTDTQEQASAGGLHIQHYTFKVSICCLAIHYLTNPASHPTL